ncbi:hypothetical protein PEC18_16605 [Paucibacter sp. O1-1]|nr:MULTISPECIES: hypothetical protein [unclassified Roseateles]MCU7372441.1 hypothetical protein [Paucibacter sp. O1-1]MCX2862870.1 hypothetical protein [Paucibacter sp. PLA-PC-4]MCZ7884417.1 hypothetical protein [Paucibacter sp. M5-1]MDA3827434.1 hypothetical protein [Paucibacter sp. O1-1]
MTQFTSPRPQILNLRKPRNPLVAPSLMRQAGRHGSAPKAQRQQANLELRQQIWRSDSDRSP